MVIKENMYQISLYGSNIIIDARVNDIPIHTDMVTFDIVGTVNIPIGALVRGGENNVTITARKVDPDQDVRCEVGIRNGEEMISEKVNCGDDLQSSGEQESSFVFQSETLNEFPWESHGPIEINDEVKQRLLARYVELQDLIIARDYDGIKKFLLPRLESEASFLGVTVDRVAEQYVDSNIKDNIEVYEALMYFEHLRDLDNVNEYGDSIVLETAANGCLVRLMLESAENGSRNSIIQWYQGDTETTISIPVWFMLTDGEVFIAIR
jgi:hypothetical protein